MDFIQPAPEGVIDAPESGPEPVIFDCDMDFDDALALAYLCEEHKLGRIDLRAVTVTNDGFGVPSRTARHALSVLEQCGLPSIPIAQGSTYNGVHSAPPELMKMIENVLTDALGDGGLPRHETPMTAVELITRTVIQSSRPVTVIATGPMTNLATAAYSRQVANGIQSIRIMGGALRVSGNLYGSALPGFDNSQEFNMWMDPPSARALLRFTRPGTVVMVPLDATACAPITRAFIDRLAADQRTPGARLAYRIISQPDLLALVDIGIMYWWDGLAAVTAVHDDGSVAAFRCERIDIVLDGIQSGRTVVKRHGYPIKAALSADGSAFEQRFLDSLNGRR